MAVTWKVVCLDSTKTVGSLSDVVTNVHWTASDSETVGSETYTGYSYGSVGLSAPDGASFLPYSNIKESDAIAWAKSALGGDEVSTIEKIVEKQISEAKTPTTSSGVPW
jgi:hypothetical protein|tara:strand:+ start:210 stop:536 length:327 start_codon:yes stop_codon:yes gene_type:complete